MCQPHVGLGERERDPEVGNERPPPTRRCRRVPGEEDVLRLDVAVNDAACVRIAERLGHVASDAHRLVDRQVAIALEAVPQRLALDVRHREVEQAVRLARVVDGHDPGVGELRHRLDLAVEALCSHGDRDLGAQHLERDEAVVLEVVGEVDPGHRSDAEFPLDAVLGAERAAEELPEISRHHGPRHRCSYVFLRVGD